MNKNVLIVLGGAVAIALVVAVLVQVTLDGKKPAPAPVKKVANVQILVAKKNLDTGHTLTSEDMRWQDWPENNVFPTAIKRKNGEAMLDVASGRLVRPIMKDEPIVKSALVGTEGNFVAASLSPGMRAVSISTSASSMVAGFIGPGDHVDIMLTYRESFRVDDDNPEVQNAIELTIDKLATETIMQNVKVLAVDQAAKRNPDSPTKVGKTITLEVTLEEAERLSLASELGDITLTLRGIGDDETIKTEWPIISDARLTRMNDEVLNVYRNVKNDSGISSKIVRIYNGSSVQEVPAK